MERHLMTLGQQLAVCQDECVRDRLDLPRGRAWLLSAVVPRPNTARIYRLFAIAALLFGAMAVGFFLRGPLPAAHSVTATSAVMSGEWIAASRDAAVPLQFADGTSLILEPNGRARVTDVVPQGATVTVERGALRAHVQPRSGSRWRIEVGPFRVTVVGTEFDVSWHPEFERFSLVLRKGAVSVTGPVIDGDRVVRAGEQLEVWVARGELRSSRLDESSNSLGTESRKAPASAVSSGMSASGAPGEHRASEEASAVSSSFPVLRTPSDYRASEEASATVGPPKAMDTIRLLARADRYRDALVEAERAGFDGLCASASSADLLLLGDVARLAGNVGRAQQAYVVLRQRFVGGPAAQAAFMLGRIAQDQQGAYVEAATYFATYLREAQNGVFAREAASRLVESRMHGGDRAGARSAAAQYLEDYPSGPYAEKAREVLMAP